jgi:hypothetical protein
MRKKSIGASQSKLETKLHDLGFKEIEVFRVAERNNAWR